MEYDAKFQILDAINDSNRLFEDFKQRYDGETQALRREIEVLEAKLRRPGFGPVGSAGARSEMNLAVRNALLAVCRGGSVGEYNAAIAAVEPEFKASISSGPDGGFALPKVIDGMIENTELQYTPMRGEALVVQVSTSDYHRLVDQRGLVGANWLGEKTPPPVTSAGQLVDIAPPMGILEANVQATQTMLDDVFFNAEQWLADDIGAQFGSTEGDAFINGGGVSQPRGLLTYPVATTADGTRPFGTIKYLPTGVSGAWAASNPADLFYTVIGDLRRGYRANAKWYMAPSTLATIRQMKDNYGRYLLDANSIQPGSPAMLAGYAVVEDEHFPAIGASSLSVAFGDMRRSYVIVDRVGTRMLRDPFSSKPYVNFYCTKRVGGSLLNSEAIRLIRFSAS